MPRSSGSLLPRSTSRPGGMGGRWRFGAPLQVAALAAGDVTEFAHALRKSAEVSIGRRLRTPNEIGDQWPLGSHLRDPAHRPQHRNNSKAADELAPVHSITSSARASTLGGMSRRSALAVLRLITSSYLVGAWTGRSAGFSPLRMRST